MRYRSEKVAHPVDDNSPVFPGDTPFQREWSARIEANCPVNVARLTLSPHVGAHADAPLHYDTQGLPVGALDLTPYLGPCRLIHALDVGPLIRPEDLKDALGHPPPRVLVRTCRHFPQHTFDTQLSAFAPETIAWLADLGNGRWRVGLTKFATRMLGEMVDHGFELEPGAAVACGQVIGWVEGFKAISDVFCVVDGQFLGANPLLKTKITLVNREPHGQGWLYAALGTPDPRCFDVHSYVTLLDKTIDKILEKEAEEEHS